MCILLGSNIAKKYCFVNVVLQYLYCALRTTDQNWKFENSLEGQTSKCLFDTAYNISSSHGVDKLKLKLSGYNAFYHDEVQQDSSECLQLLIKIMNKRFVPCSANEDMATFYRDSLFECLFSLVPEKYIVCHICGPRSSLETATALYITPTNNASMQALVLQGHKQKLN